MPTGIEEAVVGAVGALGAVMKLAENPIIAWFMIIVALSIDSGIGAFLNWNGVVGAIFSFVINNLAHVSITITSFQVLFLVAISPVVLWIMRRAVISR